MSANVSTLKCPRCQGSDVQKLEGQCALCPHCSKSKRSIYRFCWACQREWPSNWLGNSCTHPNCALRAALLSVQLIVQPGSSANGCPYFRACPGCKALLTHNGIGCPNITCPHCHIVFCFRCLRQNCIGVIPMFLFHDMRNGDIRRSEPCRIVDNRQIVAALDA